MFILLVSALVGIATSSYGDVSNEYYQRPVDPMPIYKTPEDRYGVPSYETPRDDNDNYGVPHYETQGNDNDNYGVPGYPNKGYESPQKGKCRQIKHFSVRGQRTAHAKFFHVNRKHANYTVIGCPNSGKPYALVAAQEGADTSFAFGPGVQIQDAILLASGFNFDFLAKCHKDRIEAKAFNNRKVSIKRVACVELAQPNPVTVL
uniref:Conserved secreted protein n=1 Tax=Caenorhabditis tropicalis TaxID=1561998 RepID=A0A1I7T0G5_9PELO